MKKVISFSIYGDSPKYTVGLLKNIELSKIIYPNWDIYVYYNNTVPVNIIEKYKKYDHVKIINMDGYNIPGMFWRFLPKDCERFISRDADSRLSTREKYAVDEWIESSKKMHVMRDHPHHSVKAFGGMVGFVVDEKLILENEINKWIIGKDRNLFNKWGDVLFLETIYDKYLKEDQLITHDSFFVEYPCSKPFPKVMENYHFVGEIFDENDQRYYQYTEWINKKELR
jgi:hypothetical protein